LYKLTNLFCTQAHIFIATQRAKNHNNNITSVDINNNMNFIHFIVPILFSLDQDADPNNTFSLLFTYLSSSVNTFYSRYTHTCILCILYLVLLFSNSSPTTHININFSVLLNQSFLICFHIFFRFPAIAITQLW